MSSSKLYVQSKALPVGCKSFLCDKNYATDGVTLHAHDNDGGYYAATLPHHSFANVLDRFNNDEYMVLEFLWDWLKWKDHIEQFKVIQLVCVGGPKNGEMTQYNGASGFVVKNELPAASISSFLDKITPSSSVSASKYSMQQASFPIGITIPIRVFVHESVPHGKQLDITLAVFQEFPGVLAHAEYELLRKYYF